VVRLVIYRLVVISVFCKLFVLYVPEGTFTFGERNIVSGYTCPRAFYFVGFMIFCLDFMIFWVLF
jgi:hypothetical protein